MNIILAFFSGILIILSTVSNSRLAERTNQSVTVTIHFFTGLLAALLIQLIMRKPVNPEAASFPLWLFPAGGFLGVIVLINNNILVRRLTVLMFTLLLITGQLAAGLLLDRAAGIALEPLKAAGLGLILTGLLFDTLFSRKAAMT